MGFPERLAGRVRIFRIDSACRLAAPHGVPAVKHRRKPQPFQRFRIPHCAEVVQVPVIIGDQAIDREHFADAFFSVRYPKETAAFYKIPIVRQMVRLFQYTHKIRRRNELCVFRDKILTYAVLPPFPY